MAQMLGRVTFNINAGDRLRCIADVLLVLPRDGSRIFSRGGGLIFKKFQKFCRPLIKFIFRSTHDFPSTPRSIFTKIFAPQDSHQNQKRTFLGI